MLKIGTPFWLVWSPRGNLPKHRHATLQSAVTEAGRLSHLKPGLHFYVCEIVGFAMDGPEANKAVGAKRWAKNRPGEEP